MKFKRSKMAIALSFALLVAGSSSAEVALTTFTSGANATASEVNGNFTSLKTAVDLNTTTTAANTTSIATATSALASVTNSIATNAASITTNSTAISTATTTANVASSSAATNTTNITTNTSAIASNTTNITANATAISSATTPHITIADYITPSTITSKTYEETSSTGTVTNPIVTIVHTPETTTVGRKLIETDGTLVRNFQVTLAGEFVIESYQAGTSAVTTTLDAGILGAYKVVFPAKVFEGMAINYFAPAFQSGSVIGISTGNRVINKINIPFDMSGTTLNNCVHTTHLKNAPITKIYCKDYGLVYQQDGGSGVTRKLTSIN